MPTSMHTDRKVARHIDFSSADTDDLISVLSLFFGEETTCICRHVDEQGYHLARIGHGRYFIPNGRWTHLDGLRPHIHTLAREVVEWLDGLTRLEQMDICRAHKEEMAYSVTSGKLAIIGFRAYSVRSTDGEYHRMLTIIPTWV